MPHGYGTLVAELKDDLTRQRYNRVAVHNYCRNAGYFLAYLAARKIALEAVTPADVTAYLRFAVRQFRKRHGRAPARYWVGIPRSGIHALLKLALKRWPPEPAATDAGERLCREVCDQYQKWLREERGLAMSSVDALLWEARNFCAWLIKHSNANFADLTVRDLDIYMDMRARGLTRKSLKDVAERLRSLLRHLHRTGRIAADLSQHVIAPHALGAPALRAVPMPIGRPHKVTVRFRDSEMRQVVEMACQRGMTRTGWIVALVRARLGSPVQHSPGEHAALRAVVRELNRIGSNINQIARAANTSVLHGKAVDFDFSEIRETRAVIEIALAQLHGALDNNADYWETRR